MPYLVTLSGDDLAEQETDTHHYQATQYSGLSVAQMRVSSLESSEPDNLHFQELWQHAEHDQTYQALKSIITEGFPNNKASMPESLKPFWSIKDSLSIDDDLIVYSCRLFIPTSLLATKAASTPRRLDASKNQSPQLTCLMLATA